MNAVSKGRELEGTLACLDSNSPVSSSGAAETGHRLRVGLGLAAAGGLSEGVEAGRGLKGGIEIPAVVAAVAQGKQPPAEPEAIFCTF